MRFLIALVLMAAPVAAEGLPPLEEVLGEIEGAEFQARGEITHSGDMRNFYFQNDLGRFDAILALDRSALSKLEPCNWLDGVNCQATISADVRFAGGDVQLRIFNLNDLVIPE